MNKKTLNLVAKPTTFPFEQQDFQTRKFALFDDRNPVIKEVSRLIF